MRFAIAVQQESGNFAIRGNGEIAKSLEEFMSMSEVKETLERLTRFGDVWKIVQVMDDPHMPNKTVFLPDTK